MYRVLILDLAVKRYSWVQCYWSTGLGLYDHRNFNAHPSTTQPILKCENVEFLHSCVTVPKNNPHDKVVREISKLKYKLALLPSPNA